MKKRVSIILLIAIIIVAAFAVYFTFFYSRICDNQACFNNALEKCSKKSYVNDGKEAVWIYTIKGKSSEECVVDIRLDQVKEGNVNLASLEGKEMTCYVPLGIVVSPEKDLKKCHGLLKEEMQDMIINNLHSYIVKNIGEVSEELNKVV